MRCTRRSRRRSAPTPAPQRGLEAAVGAPDRNCAATPAGAPRSRRADAPVPAPADPVWLCGRRAGGDAAPASSAAEPTSPRAVTRRASAEGVARPRARPRQPHEAPPPAPARRPPWVWMRPSPACPASAPATWRSWPSSACKPCAICSTCCRTATTTSASCARLTSCSGARRSQSSARCGRQEPDHRR